jgi:energy-coupling factor transporter transmembrane protein EcfT
LCCGFRLFFFVLCTICCQFLWIVHFWLPLWYSLFLTHWLTKYNNSGGVYLCVSYEICTHSRTGMVAGVNLMHTGIFISLLLLFVTVLTLERDFDILYRYSNLADDHEFCPVSCVPYVASFSGLFIVDCPFGIL